MSIFAAAAVALFVTIALALIRAAAGPTVFDRILALNMIGTKTILLIAMLGFATGRYDFIDIALVYAVLNLVGTVAVMRYLVGEKEREQ